MGLSSKTVRTKSNKTATTTPNVPSFFQEPVNNYYGKVNDILNANPQSFTTPASYLQNYAFENASTLGNPGGYDTALMQTLNARNDLNNIAPTQVSYVPNMGPLKSTNVASVNGPSVSQASLASLNPVTKAGYQGYSSPQLGNASTVNLGGYTANQVGDVGSFLDNTVERVNGESLLNNLQSYMNPYLRDVVDTSATDYDNYADQQRAELARKGAAAKAFGGSGYALAQGQAEGDLARGRASLLAGLRSDAFNTGLNASNLDAARRQEAGIFNAGAQNDRDLARGQLGMQGALFNAGALNDAAAFGANAGNQGQLFNAGVQNDFRLAQAGYDADAARFGASAYNTAQLADAAAANQYGLAQFNAANDLSQFNTGQTNQANNLQYSNEAQAARQNAQAANDAASQTYDTTAANNRFNADQFQDTSEFNANLELQNIIQQLASANQYADIVNAQDASARANTALQGDLGQQLWEIQNRQNLAPLIQAQLAQGLLDPSIAQLFTGQTINSNSTGTQKSSGGLLGQLLAAGSQLGSAAILASERRVKRDISLVWREHDGLGRYTFNYVWDASGEPLRHGVMADEVAELRPWALGPVMNGIQTVDYSKLEAR